MDLDLISRAEAVIARAATETPLVSSADLDARTRARVLLKPESLQRSGSFKFRGAYFRLSELSADERRRGVVTYSSGNFGKAVAAAGALLGVRATIVVPIDAPATKVGGARALGAEIVVSDHGHENRESAAARLAEQVAARTGAVLLHPFEDARLLAGHAAMIRELLGQARALGADLDVIVVPCGGGGLCAACCLALRGARRAPRIVAVEPEGYHGLALSLAAGERRPAPGGPPSLCDALQAPSPGKLAFSAIAGMDVVTAAISDDQVAAALRYAAETLELVIEPSAAAALAALLEGKLDAEGKTIALVLTGGNVDPSLLARLVAGGHR